MLRNPAIQTSHEILGESNVSTNIANFFLQDLNFKIIIIIISKFHNRFYTKQNWVAIER